MLHRIDTALIVRDPGTARSADAYEGLRRQVAASASDRRKHIVQLTELAEALRRGDVDALPSLVEEWLMQAHVLVVDDAAVAEAFEFVGSSEGEAHVLVPAYVDGATGAVVRRGRAERVEVVRHEPVPVEAHAQIDRISDADRESAPTDAVSGPVAEDAGEGGALPANPTVTEGEAR